LYEVANKFNFNCHMTACCCQNMEIFLNPYDILKISENLNVTTTEIIDEFILFLEDRETGLFRPILKSARTGLCKFNIDKLCTIHVNRPLSCRLFPLARISGKFLLQQAPFCTGLTDITSIKLTDYLNESSVEEYLSMSDLYHLKYDVLKNLNNGLLKNEYYNNLLNILLYDIDFFYNGELKNINSKDKFTLSLYLVDKLLDIFKLNRSYDKKMIIEELFMEGDKFIVKNFN